MRRRSIREELEQKKDYTLLELYASYSKKRLSQEARCCMADASHEITGMYGCPNEYWLPQVMSEALEAAEALGL